MTYSKEDAIRVVTSCAENYKKELENKMLLLVCMDKQKRMSCIEFSFFNYNFLHLTGLKIASRRMFDSDEKLNIISSVRFYEKCLDHKLMASDFEFSDNGTTPLKLDVLPQVICKNLSASMVGNFNSKHPKLYTDKIAGGTKAYMGFVEDTASHRYVPNTVVKEDLRSNVSKYARVIVTYRKYINDSCYSEVVYAAKKIDWDSITFPASYTYLPKPNK